MADDIKEHDKSGTYVWFDAEFTSLELERAHFMQVALILTDPHLNRFVSEQDDINLYVKLGRREKVSPWVQENLGECLSLCRSNKAIDVEDVDELLANYLDKHIAPPADEVEFRPVLAGNSIHNDWFLIRKYLPNFAIPSMTLIWGYVPRPGQSSLL